MKWIFFILIATSISAQNTVGTIFHDPERSLEGFNLFTPNFQPHTFLIDNCGRVINIWMDSPMARTGIEQYLLEDGSLLKAKFDNDITFAPSFGAGGSGGILERRSWDNELLWQYIIRDSIQRQHHDIHPMPNGNVLAIVWHRYFVEDIVAAGFDTLSNEIYELWTDKIVEINPESDEIVWQWSAWDHLIQDRFSDRENFGVVSDHPELIDINYQKYSFGRADWMHANGIDYNEELDQVVVSVKNFNEVWIIDHSTTIEEAASHEGGNSGIGGDLLFRWGNPEAYQSGTEDDRMLFNQHDPEWIVDPSSEYDGMIMLYNNFVDFNHSLGTIINPSFNAAGGTYLTEEGKFLPHEVYRNVSHPDTSLQYSTVGSNIELLPNGNFLMHAATVGFAFELTDNEEVVWEYRVPLRNGVPIKQGSILSQSENFTFSLRRYPLDFSGFDGKDISPKSYLEDEPNIEACTGLVNTSNEVFDLELSIYPNPVIDHLVIRKGFPLDNLIIYNNIGTAVDFMAHPSDNEIVIDVSNYPKGLYFIKCIVTGTVSKFIKI